MASLTLTEIADKADAYSDNLQTADALRFALRNLAMLVRQHVPGALSPREEPRPLLCGCLGDCKGHPRCDACDGRGQPCPKCNGRGFLLPAPAPSRAQVLACPYCKPGRPCYADTTSPDPSKRCPECKGRGWHPGDCHPREECAKCEGTGWAASPSGNGSAAPSGPREDPRPCSHDRSEAGFCAVCGADLLEGT